ncbi:MAG: hypothetical protein ABW220_03910 [Burkholderiaceae bacterium]
MQKKHAFTLWGKSKRADSGTDVHTQFSTLDTLTVSLDQAQHRPLRRDLILIAMVLTALTVALARIA